MKQFGVIFSHELRTYLKNKVFVGITLVLVLVMAGVMFFPRIREAFDSQPEPDIPQGGEVSGAAPVLGTLVPLAVGAPAGKAPGVQVGHRQPNRVGGASAPPLAVPVD